MMLKLCGYSIVRHIFTKPILLSLCAIFLLPVNTVRAEVIACANLTNGSLRIVETVEDCKQNSEQIITWPDNNELQVLTERVAELEAQNAVLSAELSCISPDSNEDDLYFDGCNVHVLNGVGSTDSVNGYGNLIIGYDEPSSHNLTPFCSDGRFYTQEDCESRGYFWGTNQKTGSHNLVIGDEHSYTQHGGLVAGNNNIINGFSASVSGGAGNMASNNVSSVSGGARNIASGVGSSVSGGWTNTASGGWSSVSGGFMNMASGDVGSVSGGIESTASGDFSSVSGGVSNISSGYASSVSGGLENTASGGWSSVSGGRSRQAPGNVDWAAGSLLENQ